MSSSLSRIRDLIKSYGVGRMAKDSGLNRSFLSEVASGKATPSVQVLDRISGVLGIKFVEQNSHHFGLSNHELFELLKLSLGVGTQIVHEEWVSICDHIKCLKPVDIAINAINAKFTLDFPESAFLVPRLILDAREEIDFNVLRTLVDDKRYYGYLMSLCFEISKDTSFEREARQIKNECNIQRESIPFGVYCTKIQATRNPVADRWNYHSIFHLHQIQHFCRMDKNELALAMSLSDIGMHQRLTAQKGLSKCGFHIEGSVTYQQVSDEALEEFALSEEIWDEEDLVEIQILSHHFDIVMKLYWRILELANPKIAKNSEY